MSIELKPGTGQEEWNRINRETSKHKVIAGEVKYVRELAVQIYMNKSVEPVDAVTYAMRFWRELTHPRVKKWVTREIEEAEEANEQ